MSLSYRQCKLGHKWLDAVDTCPFCERDDLRTQLAEAQAELTRLRAYVMPPDYIADLPAHHQKVFDDLKMAWRLQAEGYDAAKHENRDLRAQLQRAESDVAATQMLLDAERDNKAAAVRLLKKAEADAAALREALRKTVRVLLETAPHLRVHSMWGADYDAVLGNAAALLAKISSPRSCSAVEEGKADGTYLLCEGQAQQERIHNLAVLHAKIVAAVARGVAMPQYVTDVLNLLEADAREPGKDGEGEGRRRVGSVFGNI